MGYMEKRDVMVPLRLTKPGAKKLDELRGGWTRSEYIRRAISFAAKAGLRGPIPGDNDL